ncbi:MAG: DUF1579 family protein [Candidatus Kapaibacteriota bacterium]
MIVYNAISQNDLEFQEEYFYLNSKHELLSQFAGQWKTTISYFGDTQEEYSQGTMEANFTLNFRIIELNFRLNSSAGIPYEMKYTIGYDGLSKKFFLIILNNLTNEILILKGTYSEKEKLFVFNGTSIDAKKKIRTPLIMKFLFERNNKILITSILKQGEKEKIVSKAMLIKIQSEEQNGM